jgi:hypothetical protein
VRTTLDDGKDVSISIANISLLKSSMTLKVLNLLPLVSESDIKSIDQQICGFVGAVKGSFILSGMRFLYLRL